MLRVEAAFGVGAAELARVRHPRTSAQCAPERGPGYARFHRAARVAAARRHLERVVASRPIEPAKVGDDDRHVIERGRPVGHVPGEPPQRGYPSPRSRIVKRGDVRQAPRRAGSSLCLPHVPLPHRPLCSRRYGLLPGRTSPIRVTPGSPNGGMAPTVSASKVGAAPLDRMTARAVRVRNSAGSGAPP